MEGSDIGPHASSNPKYILAVQTAALEVLYYLEEDELPTDDMFDLVAQKLNLAREEAPLVSGILGSIGGHVIAENIRDSYDAMQKAVADGKFNVKSELEQKEDALLDLLKQEGVVTAKRAVNKISLFTKEEEVAQTAWLLDHQQQCRYSGECKFGCKSIDMISSLGYHPNWDDWAKAFGELHRHEPVTVSVFADAVGAGETETRSYLRKRKEGEYGGYLLLTDDLVWSLNDVRDTPESRKKIKSTLGFHSKKVSVEQLFHDVAIDKLGPQYYPEVTQDFKAKCAVKALMSVGKLNDYVLDDAGKYFVKKQANGTQQKRKVEVY